MKNSLIDSLINGQSYIMPANRNALIRYRAIDNCLTNKYRQWTLDELIESVSDALYEYEGMAKGISRRTIQADLQMMRSDKLGYNAPIVVIDRKYYAYEDPNYSITQIPLTGHDLSRMSQAVEVLKQFKGFTHFEELNAVIQKLEAHVYSAASNRRAVIDFEKNENLKGLAFLDVLYQTIVQQKVVDITYRSFKAKEASQFVFHVWWLKEFKNRWFAVGVRENQPDITHLALDRILAVDPTDTVDYRPNADLTPANFYQDVIGVTVNAMMRPSRVQIWVAPEHAPYVETKPLHHSQKLIERREDGIIVEVFVQLNLELEREILGFGEGMRVLSPARLQQRMQQRLIRAVRQYDFSEE